MKTNNKFPWGENREWAERTKIIASFIKKDSSVLDVGCGFCHLKKYLKNCRYIGVDKDTWVDEIVVADLNKQEFPNVGLFDYVVCQGIIEYIDDPENFLKQIRKYGDQLIITYKSYTRSDIERRNVCTFSETEEHLKKSGWKIINSKKIDGNQTLYICKKYESILA